MPSRGRFFVGSLGALALLATILGNIDSSRAVATQPRLGRDAENAVQDSLLAAATFDSVWSRVQNTYWDPEMSGVDWEGVRAELRPEAVAAETPSELRGILSEMLGRIGQSHFTLIPGEADASFLQDEIGGTAGPGLDVRWVEGALLVTRVVNGGPAARAGIRPGWIVETIDDMAIDSLREALAQAPLPGRFDEEIDRWLHAAARSRLLGPENSDVRLLLRDGGDRQVEMAIGRNAGAGQTVEFGNLPPVHLEVGTDTDRLASGADVGIVRLTAWFPPAAPLFAEAVDQFRDADALVLDLRGNPGGVGGMVMGAGGHFLDEPVSLGTMRSRQGALEFVVNPQRIAADGRRVDPYSGPLVILVDRLTASTSEIFAGGLQALGRATVMGETSAGQALPALIVPLPNGDRLLHAVADFTDPEGVRLEGRGVVPDVSVPLDRDLLLSEGDPVLAQALRWLEARFSR